ncbi:hypothetical protein [Tuwongella immobilis]|uniref:Uncharacterized protein n=1 Tax=Tuwongella immobilis TaxID=692036 RepID=A0A6C2YSN0_9BACT|nr:hypothetical protein [Tuwongella immobilis]VIP04718.1 unnamed protein product [Tuwongella immobilis]VTS06795.1 unnamed protein product [Tuwongella immobilis]
MVDLTEVDGYLGWVWVIWPGRENAERINVIRDDDAGKLRYITDQCKERQPSRADRSASRVELEDTGRESQERFRQTLLKEGWDSVEYCDD